MQEMYHKLFTNTDKQIFLNLFLIYGSYAMSQYCLSKSHTIKDERAFVIPQGNKKINATSQLFTVSYDRTPQVVVTFLSEADLRLMLWQLHENYEQVNNLLVNLFCFWYTYYFYLKTGRKKINTFTFKIGISPSYLSHGY